MLHVTGAPHRQVQALEAYRRTRKGGAVGVDGQTGKDYEANLQDNLQSLLDQAKSGTYIAPPVRRAHIPKAGSTTETRALGIPTFEDKLLQRAVVMVLETIYEQDFLDCSYGFRPGRSAHQALEALWQRTMKMGDGWIMEVDIRKFFDTINHGHLRAFLKRRVVDGVLLRLIDKWLNAGTALILLMKRSIAEEGRTHRRGASLRIQPAPGALTARSPFRDPIQLPNSLLILVLNLVCCVDWYPCLVLGWAV